MSIIEKIKEHKARLNGELGCFDVPEIGETIYFRRSWSLKDREKVFSLYNQNKSSEAQIETIIRRALDKDGKPLFRTGDRAELMLYFDGDLLLRITNQFTDDSAEHAEAVGKTPNSDSSTV